MHLFLDCEFNGFGGELLSIALVSARGEAFYRIVDGTTQYPTPWVEENVLPILGTFAGQSIAATIPEIRSQMQHFLCMYDSIHVIADWPEDIIHFCKLLLTDKPGERINTPPLTLEIVRFDSGSELPHNALADALGIRKEWLRRSAKQPLHAG